MRKKPKFILKKSAAFALPGKRSVPKEPRQERKPASERKELHIRIMVNAAEKGIFEDAATRDGRTLSGWIRFVCLRAALEGETPDAPGGTPGGP